MAFVHVNFSKKKSLDNKIRFFQSRAMLRVGVTFFPGRRRIVLCAVYCVAENTQWEEQFWLPDQKQKMEQFHPRRCTFACTNCSSPYTVNVTLISVGCLFRISAEIVGLKNTGASVMTWLNHFHHVNFMAYFLLVATTSSVYLWEKKIAWLWTFHVVLHIHLDQVQPASDRLFCR